LCPRPQAPPSSTCRIRRRGFPIPSRSSPRAFWFSRTADPPRRPSAFRVMGAEPLRNAKPARAQFGFHLTRGLIARREARFLIAIAAVESADQHIVILRL